MASNFLRIQSNGISNEAYPPQATWEIDFPLTAARSILLAQENGSCLVRSETPNVASSLAKSIQSIIEIGYGTSSFFVDCDTRNFSLRAVGAALEQIKLFSRAQKDRSGLVVFGNLDPFVIPYENRRQDAERIMAQAKVAKAIADLLVDVDGPNVCAITAVSQDAPLFEHFAAVTTIDETLPRPKNTLREGRRSPYLLTTKSLPDCAY